jgi:hypothetical protein
VQLAVEIQLFRNFNRPRIPRSQKKRGRHQRGASATAHIAKKRTSIHN